MWMFFGLFATIWNILIIGCSNPNLGSANHNLWNCGGTLGETSLDFGGSCQGGDMQVSLQKCYWKCLAKVSFFHQWPIIPIKNLISLFPLIFLSKHISLYALGRLKWILDIIWILNQHFNLKNLKKLGKTSLNVKFFDWDYLHLTALMKESYFSMYIIDSFLA